MTDIEASVREFIRTNFVLGSGSLGASDSLMDAGIIDSTGVLELTGFLETKYGLKVEDAELVPDNLDSIARIVSFVERKQAAKAGE